MTHNNEADKTAEAFKRLKDTAGGRRIIAWVISACGIDNEGFTGNELELARVVALHDFCKQFLYMCGELPSNFYQYFEEEIND
jgi:hypothetical protein